MEILVPFF